MSANFTSTNDISISTAKIMAEGLRRGSKVSVILCALQNARVSKETLAYSNLRHHLKRCALHPVHGGIVHELLKRFTAILEKKEDPINEAIEKELGIEKENDNSEETEEVTDDDMEDEIVMKSSVSNCSDLISLSSKENIPVTKVNETTKPKKEKKIAVVENGKIRKRASPLKLIQSGSNKAENRLPKKNEKRALKKKTSKLPTWEELF